jgi:hypothetical protein
MLLNIGATTWTFSMMVDVSESLAVVCSLSEKIPQAYTSGRAADAFVSARPRAHRRYVAWGFLSQHSNGKPLFCLPRPPKSSCVFLFSLCSHPPSPPPPPLLLTTSLSQHHGMSLWLAPIDILSASLITKIHICCGTPQDARVVWQLSLLSPSTIFISFRESPVYSSFHNLWLSEFSACISTMGRKKGTTAADEIWNRALC